MHDSVDYSSFLLVAVLAGKVFFRRVSYAISRTFITKNDRGTKEFNISEIGGKPSEAGLSNLYYPAAERGFDKTAKNFATQTVITQRVLARHPQKHFPHEGRIPTEALRAAGSRDLKPKTPAAPPTITTSDQWPRVRAWA